VPVGGRIGRALALQSLLAQAVGQALRACRHVLGLPPLRSRRLGRQRSHRQRLAVAAGPVAEAAPVGAAAPDALGPGLRQQAGGGDQQGQQGGGVHGASPGSVAGGGAGRGGLGRGGWAWMRASALAMSPAISSSLASSERSMAFAIASRSSGEGRLST
jgi:hypothetical protein